MSNGDYCKPEDASAFVFPLGARVYYWPLGRNIADREGPYKIVQRWRLGHGEAVYRLRAVEGTVGGQRRGGHSENNLTLEDA